MPAWSLPAGVRMRCCEHKREACHKITTVIAKHCNYETKFSKVCGPGLGFPALSVPNIIVLGRFASGCLTTTRASRTTSQQMKQNSPRESFLNRTSQLSRFRDSCAAVVAYRSIFAAIDDDSISFYSLFGVFSVSEKIFGNLFIVFRAIVLQSMPPRPTCCINSQRALHSSFPPSVPGRHRLSFRRWYRILQDCF